MNLMRVDLPNLLPGLGLAPGSSHRMGATVNADGVNFALFSAHAEAVDLCLFSPDGVQELARIPLREREGDIWHIQVNGLGAGTVYGYRVHGRFAPLDGDRFNANKLLLDPYARKTVGAMQDKDSLLGYPVRDARQDLAFDTSDSAAAMPKAVVVADSDFDWQGTVAPRVPWSDTVIYEAHVKGLTALHPQIPPDQAGHYAGLASDAMLAHYQRLGITTLQLLPLQAFVDDRFLLARGLRNYWGYQTIGFFAPEPRYASADAILELQTAVRRLHQSGIEVIMDVVYNHSGEGDQLGPTLSFRGLDNRSYYHLAEDRRYYVNHTGTGNCLNLSHPQVLRMVMDSLRYWVETFHIDGFRFDLASVLGRNAAGFDAEAGFYAALCQDPVLSQVKLIAEPWDLGPFGYQLGNYPAPMREWNDQFRDGVRRYWRGDAGMASDLAGRLLGSAHLFDHSGRAATSSVNFLTSHDGFTLEDVVSYAAKRNAANGEGNRDGHDQNHSDPMGPEGAAVTPDVAKARDRRKRAMLATLFLAQGTPMLLAGDELSNSQSGNNNAYAQDNPLGWLDWSGIDAPLVDFTARLIALRKRLPVLRQRRFLHGRLRDADGLPDVIWRRVDGRVPSADDWHDPAFQCLCVELRMAAEGKDSSDEAVYAVFNTGAEVEVTLPDTVSGWHLCLNTAEMSQDASCRAAMQSGLAAPAQSVMLLTNASLDRAL